jgi:hypothetical protein
MRVVLSFQVILSAGWFGSFLLTKSAPKKLWNSPPLFNSSTMQINSTVNPADDNGRRFQHNDADWPSAGDIRTTSTRNFY